MLEWVKGSWDDGRMGENKARRSRDETRGWKKERVEIVGKI